MARCEVRGLQAYGCVPTCCGLVYAEFCIRVDDVRLAGDCRSSVSWSALTWVAAVRWNKHAAQDHFWCRSKLCY
ncbi:hypothetical protein JG688_00008313 [Phytophthora aleatoria]|uniref:Uncharacterized protein n=1 Tax=Phytophthora aleatoria TaxID=2496075 RepID=A0A8J5III3_9STRA|nr:hypothetical protein JG688_00008313 [Phytophthora aleatoria]